MKINCKSFYIALVFLLVILAFPYQSRQAYAQQYDREFLAGVPANFPPQYSIDSKTGKPTGFAIDVMDEVARRSGIKVRYVMYPTWPKTVEAIKKGEVDILPNMGIIAEREYFMDITSPIETFNIVIFVRKTTANINSVEDLNGKEVAVVQENKGLFLMQEKGGSMLQIYASQDEAFMSLISGKSDALVYPEPPIKLLSQKIGFEDHIKIVGKPLFEVKRGIAVRKGNQELLKKLDDEVKTFVTTPQYKKIYAKWYGNPTPYWTAKRMAVFGGVLFAFTIATLLIWRFFSVLRLSKELQSALTEHKRMEESLRISEEKFKALAEQSITGNCIIQDSRFIYVNPHLAEIFDYRQEEMVGQKVLDLVMEADRDLVRENMRKRLSGEISFIHYTFIALKKDGSELPLEVHGSSMQYNGRPAIMATVLDITERKKLEEQLLQSQKMEAVGQLAGGIAHDFNNILSAIIGYGEIALMKMTKDDPQRLNIKHMLAGAERAAYLTKDLLMFSRKQVGKLKPVDLNEVVRNVGKFLIRVIGEDIEFKTVLHEQPLTVLADSHQLEQVLMNLATNAHSAMPNGGAFTVTVEQVHLNEDFISSHVYGKPGHYAMITVSDTGIGMDKESLKRIFEPFFTTKEVGKGTGLGLSVVYGIIKQHDGYINVYSEPGKGTTFRIYLPTLASVVTEESSAHKEEAPSRGTETILVAEDDESLRKLSRTILKQFGYTVIEAVDGEDAVRKFIENKDAIHLLLFDLIMPKKKGKEAYDEIQKIKPDMKVIFLSGYAPDIIRQKASLGNNVHLIYKPVSPFELLRKVREILDR